MSRKEDEEGKSCFLLSCALICYWHRVIVGARVGVRDRSSPAELPLFTDKETKVNNKLQGSRAKPALTSPPTLSLVLLLRQAARDDAQKPF